MSASERQLRPRHLPSARRRAQGQPVQPPARAADLPPDARNVIEFRNVCMHYPAGDIGLDGATFSVRRGEFVFIVGSTGSGKSTIMRLLIKELEPTAGAIRVAGRDLSEISRRQVPYYRRNLGAFFGSVHGTLNHLLLGDTIWMTRFEGGAHPSTDLGAIQHLAAPRANVGREPVEMHDLPIEQHD